MRKESRRLHPNKESYRSRCLHPNPDPSAISFGHIADLRDYFEPQGEYYQHIEQIHADIIHEIVATGSIEGSQL